MSIVMKILATGANGFIGRALCTRLSADGYKVRGAVRGVTQMTALSSRVEGVQVGDIGPDTDWSKALDGMDVVVHLAARVHVIDDKFKDPLHAYRTVNVAGTECLAQAAVAVGIKRFVYLSSVKVNGEGTDVRFQMSEVGGRKTEGKSRGQPPAHRGLRPGGMSEIRGHGSVSKQFFSEEDIPEPQDPYAVSKWEAEQVLHKISQETGLEVVVLRSPLVYGPGVKANFLRLLNVVDRGIPLPLANVNNRRSLIYLENLVDVIAACINHPRAAGQTFLVSDGKDLSTPELIRLIAEAMDRKARPFSLPSGMLKTIGKITGRSKEIDRIAGSLCVDTSKIRTMLGWKPPYTMAQGLQKTTEWYLNDYRK